MYVLSVILIYIKLKKNNKRKFKKSSPFQNMMNLFQQNNQLVTHKNILMIDTQRELYQAGDLVRGTIHLEIVKAVTPQFINLKFKS